MFVVVWLGAPFVAAAILRAAFARSWRRTLAIFGIGALLGVLVFFHAYLAAPRDFAHRNCSDCEELWGRWWEPRFVLFVVVIGYFSWLLGTCAGAFLRWLLAPTAASGRQ